MISPRKFFQRPQITALALRVRAILLAFEKIYSFLLIPNCTRNHLITCTYCYQWLHSTFYITQACYKNIMHSTFLSYKVFKLAVKSAWPSIQNLKRNYSRKRVLQFPIRCISLPSVQYQSLFFNTFDSYLSIASNGLSKNF